MRGRLSSSKKWTNIPRELTSQIRTVFQKTFKSQIGQGRVDADGRIYDSEIVIQVGLKPEGSSLKHSHWLVSVEYKKGKDDVVKLLNLAVDAAGSLFEQLFTAENDYDFPRIWQEVDFEGRSIFIQYTTENAELEKAADKILGLAEDDGLTGGDWEADGDDEELLDQIKQKLGVDDADDEDDKTPPSSKKPKSH